MLYVRNRNTKSIGLGLPPLLVNPMNRSAICYTKSKWAGASSHAIFFAVSISNPSSIRACVIFLTSSSRVKYALYNITILPVVTTADNIGVYINGLFHLPSVSMPNMANAPTNALEYSLSLIL